MDQLEFRSPVFVGHKDTYAIDVPFDPRVEWPDHAPVKMTLDDDPRGGRGWPVSGSINGVHFDGFVGHRYGRSYLVLSPALRDAAGVGSGDVVDVVVQPRHPHE